MKSIFLTFSLVLLISASCDQATKMQSSDAPSFVHTVYFWLNDSLTGQEISEFEKGLLDLGEVTSIVRYEYGIPAGTDREVVDNSYDFAWITYFADEAGHDQYQEDPIHLEFIEKYNHMWESVKVYDTILGKK